MSLNPKDLTEMSEAKLAAILDAARDALIGLDLQGTITSWNAAAEHLFGYSAAEMVGSSFLLVVPPLQHSEFTRYLERLSRGERIERVTSHYLKKGGKRIDVGLTLLPIFGASGEVIGVAGSAREFNRLRREEVVGARLAAIVESSDEAIVAKDLNGVVTDWNAAAERLFGYSAEEIVGRSILTIIPPELQHEEPEILARARNGQRMDHYETQRLHKSGRRLEVSLNISPIRDSSGTVIGVLKTARDVSEHRRLERARNLLVAIVESSDDAIVSKNLDGIITSWNAAAERLLGYKSEEIVGQSVLRIIPRELHHEEPGIISRLRSGEKIAHFETRRMRKNGEIFDVSLTVSPIRDEKGNVIGGSKILRDISDRKLAEAALLEKEKFAAAGRLAATLAHEVNNPLEAITNLGYLLSIHPSLDEEARNFATQLLKEVQRAGDITRQTLGYYRESRTPSVVNLETVVRDVASAKRSKLARKDVQFEAKFQPGSAIVLGMAGQLRQVLDNLIENAIEAVHPGGRIHVTGTRKQGARVELSVCDDGPGIAAENLDKIFEPFFTTKGGKGSGLGLWVSYAIIKQHDGELRARSHPDQQETVFSFDLPAASVAESGSKRSSALVS